MVQSPIAISLHNTKIDDKVKPLTYSGHWTTNCQAIIENTGKSAQLSFHKKTTDQRPYISGGPLSKRSSSFSKVGGERYIFEQMHFHWSENDHFGSEHRINERTLVQLCCVSDLFLLDFFTYFLIILLSNWIFSYSMEAHLVHFNEKYGNFDTAVAKKDGLAVVAFFIQAFGNTDCKFFSKISDAIKKIRSPGTKYTMNSGLVIVFYVLIDINI